MNTDAGNEDDESSNNDNTRIEYHPSSGCRSQTFAFKDFIRVAPDSPPHPVDLDPQVPFKTREDFEFAELALRTGMLKAQVNVMIDLFHKCIKKEGSFTLSNYAEMHKKLALASERLPKVCL